MPLFHLEIKLIARHSVFLSIYEYRKVGIIATDTWHIFHKTNTSHIPQRFAISDGYLSTGLNRCIHLLQVQQPISASHFIHLTVDTRSNNSCFTSKTKILQVINTLFDLFILTY